MSKKYVPSGYQIIDLGSLDLSTSVTLSKETSEETQILYDILKGEENKPILLKLFEENSGALWNGVAVRNNDMCSLSFVSDDASSINSVVIYAFNDELIITLAHVDF